MSFKQAHLFRQSELSYNNKTDGQTAILQFFVVIMNISSVLKALKPSKSTFQMFLTLLFNGETTYIYVYFLFTINISEVEYKNKTPILDIHSRCVNADSRSHSFIDSFI